MLINRNSKVYFLFCLFSHQDSLFYKQMGHCKYLQLRCQNTYINDVDMMSRQIQTANVLKIFSVLFACAGIFRTPVH